MIGRLLAKLLAAAAFSTAIVTAASAADLTLTIAGGRNADGAISAGVFDSANTFGRPGQALVQIRIKATLGDASVTIHNLPPGKYAAIAFHDENNNGALDVDPTGAPAEGYGVSNDARDPSGPPQFGKAAFDLAVEPKSVTVRLAY